MAWIDLKQMKNAWSSLNGSRGKITTILILKNSRNGYDEDDELTGKKILGHDEKVVMGISHAEGHANRSTLIACHRFMIKLCLLRWVGGNPFAKFGMVLEEKKWKSKWETLQKCI